MTKDDPLVRRGLVEALGLSTSNAQTHYAALGQFLAAFANVESALHVIARKLSGLSDERARFLFGGMRLADISDKIRGLIQLERADKSKQPAETLADIEACLDQVGHLAIRRHNVMHRGATYFAGALISSNSMIAKTLAAIEREIISETTLKEMHLDCGAIFLRLTYIAEAMPQTEPWLIALRIRPWHYRPQPLSTPNLKPRDKSSKSQRQPHASRASRRRDAMKKHKKD